jgi:hypothetical protein
MKLFPRSVFFLTLTVCFGIFLTHSSFAGDDWRAIDPAQLAMVASTVEKDADAEAIFWEVRVDDSKVDELSLKHYVRIKVFTERGKESQSKVDIPYLGSTQIKEIAARVIKADGSIVEMKKDDVFERTIVKISGAKLKAKSFTLPSVEPGAIIEYRWREVIPGGSANRLKLEFQRDIPVENVTYYLKPFDFMRYEPFRLDARFVKDKDGFSKITATNLPAYRDEPRTPPENELRSWVLLFSSPEKDLNVDRYWTDYGKRVYEGAKNLIKPDGEVKNQIAKIVGEATDPQEKLRRIYDFCRTKIKNTSDDASGLTDDDRKKLKNNNSPGDTLKRGQGTSTDIDCLFAALVQAAGFEAHLALSGNRDDFFFRKSLANSYFLGSSFIAVKVSDQWQFFSPAEMYTEFGMLGWPEESQDALILDPKEPFWIALPLSGPEKSLENRSAKFKLSEDGTLEGDVKIEYSGHLGFDKKEYNDDDSPTQREATLKESVKKRLSTAELSDIKIENVADPLKPFTYTYHIRIPGYAQRTGKRLFLQPDFFTHGAGPLFPAATRKYEVYFHYPWSEKEHIVIELPAGFTLDNPDAPTSITPEMTQKICANKVKILSDGHEIVYDRDFFFGGAQGISFPVTSYPAIKQLFDMINQSNEHTITLKQTATN